MSEKIKLAMVSDFACPSGFATVAHQIAKYLDDTGAYDISVLGINYHGIPNEWSRRFKVWPAKLGGDFLGVGYMRNFFMEVKPDLMFLFQDFWNIPMYMSQLPPYTQRPPVVIYYPVDSPNIKGEYMVSMSAANEIACYTKFGVEESVRAAKEAWGRVKLSAAQQKLHVLDSATVNVTGIMNPSTGESFGGGNMQIPAARLKGLTRPETYHVIPHGIDVGSFFPIPREEARKKFGFDPKWFIVGNVNRNQSRKRQDLMIRAFAKFAKDKPDARLLLHCVRADPKGWDLDQLADYYGVFDKIILTHNAFQGKLATVEELNLIYNNMDVSVNTGGGEGWGLTAFESAATGVPQVVPNWSATKEIWEGAGRLIDVAAVRHEPSMINTMQAVIDTDHCAAILDELYQDRDLLAKTGEACYNVTQKKEYNWEVVGEQFDSLLLGAMSNPIKNIPVAIDAEGIKELKTRGIIK